MVETSLMSSDGNSIYCTHTDTRGLWNKCFCPSSGLNRTLDIKHTGQNFVVHPSCWSIVYGGLHYVILNMSWWIFHKHVGGWEVLPT